MKKSMSTATLAGLCLLSSPVMAQAPGEAWAFSVMPYLWLPGIKGDLNFGPPPAGGATAKTSIDPDTYLESLDFAMMLTGTARKGRWVVGSDLIYLHFSNADSKVKSVDFNPGSGPVNLTTSAANATASVDLKGLVWQLTGGYALIQESKATFDVLAGVRYLGIDAGTDANVSVTMTGNGPNGASATVSRAGSVDKRENVWAGIVGARARAQLGESNWFANGYVDAGGGSSTFTWQGVAGIGYAYKWGDIILDYRYLYYSQDGGKLMDNLSFGGLALGANFRF